MLQSVDWGDMQEARQGIKLLSHWVAIDVADALELLSPSFLNPEVSLFHRDFNLRNVAPQKFLLLQKQTLLGVDSRL